MSLKEGSKVKIEYTGTLEDGTVFDSSEKHGQPLEFEIGKKQVIPGFEKAVVEMAVGDEKEITIEPADAYGDINDQLMQKIPRDKLPKEQEPQEGMMLMMKTPDGKQFPAKIAKVEETEITLDLNHPLAGKTLKFKIKLVEAN